MSTDGGVCHREQREVVHQNGRVYFLPQFNQADCPGHDDAQALAVKFLVRFFKKVAQAMAEVSGKVSRHAVQVVDEQNQVSLDVLHQSHEDLREAKMVILIGDIEINQHSAISRFPHQDTVNHLIHMIQRADGNVMKVYGQSSRHRLGVRHYGALQPRYGLRLTAPWRAEDGETWGAPDAHLSLNQVKRLLNA